MKVSWRGIGDNLEAHLEGSEAQLEGFEGQLEGSDGQGEGGQTDEQTDGILQDYIPYPKTQKPHTYVMLLHHFPEQIEIQSRGCLDLEAVQIFFKSDQPATFGDSKFHSTIGFSIQLPFKSKNSIPKIEVDTCRFNS